MPLGKTPLDLRPHKQRGLFWHIADHWQCLSHGADICDPGEFAAGTAGWGIDPGRCRSPGRLGALASTHPVGVCALHSLAHLDCVDCRDCRRVASSATVYRCPLDADDRGLLWTPGEFAHLAPLALASAVRW